MEEHECFYCERGETQKGLMIEICELSASRVYLWRNQFFRGRCIVAHKEHRRELFDLSADELTIFMAEISRVAGVLSELYSPNKVNYASYGDVVDHLHFHVVPKYIDEGEWNQPFSRRTDTSKFLSEEQYAIRVGEIRERLEA